MFTYQYHPVNALDINFSGCTHFDPVYVCFCFRDLFNAAFVSCWSELTEQDQDSLITSLQKALMSQDIPEIVQILLNLAEFMEHSDKVWDHQGQ